MISKIKNIFTKRLFDLKYKIELTHSISLCRCIQSVPCYKIHIPFSVFNFWSIAFDNSKWLYEEENICHELTTKNI